MHKQVKQRLETPFATKCKYVQLV